MVERLLSFISLILISLFISCSSGSAEKKEKDNKQLPVVTKDLADVKTSGILNVVTTYSSTSYFLYKGQPMGYEYDLLKRFAKHLGLELNIRVSNDVDTMFHYLNTGKVDLIAHGLTVTGKRKEQVQFSDYLYLTHQVLVQKKPDNWRKLKWSALQRSLIHDAIDLIGDTVSVRINSSYMTRLDNLSDEMGGKIHVDTLPGHLSTDRIIEMVANGDLKYTVADNNIANISASYYPELDIRVPVSFSQRMAWAVRKSSPELENALNEWIKEMKDGVAYYVIFNKYFKNERDFRRRENSEFFSLNHNRISEYDELIKSNTQNLGWDWRLMAALVYQESKFNPESESWAGAKGLMQMMPNTAERFDVTDRTNPEQSIKGGTGVLKLLWDRFDEVPDSVQRIKLAMASYNCGYGHVKDAQFLATKEGLDSNRWDSNVEEMILKLSYPENYNKEGVEYGYVRGIEPVTYVKQIFSRYDHYKQFVE